VAGELSRLSHFLSRALCDTKVSGGLIKFSNVEAVLDRYPNFVSDMRNLWSGLQIHSIAQAQL